MNPMRQIKGLREPRTARQVAIILIWLAGLLGVVSPLEAAAPPVTVPFDHLPTGFELDGIHRDLACEACHINAIFKGTPRNCGVCHITGSTFNATPKIPTHVSSTNNCAACHDTSSFRPSVHFDHAEVMGSCVSCHNGSIAQGEGPTHPATSQACEACHTVLSWNPPKAVDHTQIPLAVAGFSSSAITACKRPASPWDTSSPIWSAAIAISPTTGSAHASTIPASPPIA